MSRFTFTLALAMVAVFAFGQRVTQHANLLQNSAFDKESVAKKTSTSDKSVNLNVLYSQDFATTGTGTNGVPATWAVTSTAPDPVNQWHWLDASGNPVGSCGIPWSGAPSDRNEILITEGIPVNAVNPALWLDVSTSYYWFVDNNSDDMSIYVSDDDFATETLVWKEDNQVLVQASGMPWPYTSFQWYTAKIDLTTWAGSNIKVKFHFQSIGSSNGTKGVSWYMDNLLSVETPGYDIEGTQNLANSYDGGIYTMFSTQEIRHFYEFKANAINVGSLDVTDCYLHNEVSLNGIPVLQIDTTHFTSGATTLAVAAEDTFAIYDLTTFDMYSLGLGEYLFSQTVNCAEVDANMANNTWEFPISIVNPCDSLNNTNTMARDYRSSSSISPSMYGGALAGDEIGAQFVTMVPEHLESVSVNISSATDEGTSIIINLYQWDGTAWTLVESSTVYDITAGDIGNELTLPLLNGGAAITENTSYQVTAALFWEEGVTDIRILSYDLYTHTDLFKYSNALYIQGDATWYYTYDTPNMTLKFTHLICNAIASVNKNNNVKVYPNPTTGTINIDNVVNGSTIKVYNMLGAELEVLNNANEFNTIDLSKYNAGTYLVKVLNNDNVVVNKVNLVK